MYVIDVSVGEATAESDGRPSNSDIVGSQHVLVCALHELGSLVLRLGTSASPLVAEPATGHCTLLFIEIFKKMLYSKR